MNTSYFSEGKLGRIYGVAHFWQGNPMQIRASAWRPTAARARAEGGYEYADRVGLEAREGQRRSSMPTAFEHASGVRACQRRSSMPNGVRVSFTAFRLAF